VLGIFFGVVFVVAGASLLLIALVGAISEFSGQTPGQAVCPLVMAAFFGFMFLVGGCKLISEPAPIGPNSPVWTVVNALVRQHSVALVAQKRKKTQIDAYGQVLVKGWDRELDYFYNSLVAPHLTHRLGRVLQREERRAAALLLSKRKWRLAPAAALKVLILERVDGWVQAHERAHPVTYVEAQPWSMSAADFEAFCAGELGAGGWHARVQGRAGDQGVDVVASQAGVTAVFQCKLYSNTVGNYAVQEVFTGRLFHGASIAAVVSNAEFTAGARAAAAQAGVLLLHPSHLRFLRPDGTFRS